MTKNFRQSTLAVALCAAGVTMLSGHSARADDDVKFKGGGYGTLGAARTNVDGWQFRNEPTQWSGADKDFDLGVDSRLGLQGTVTYKSDFSITAQLLGIRRGASRLDGPGGPKSPMHATNCTTMIKGPGVVSAIPSPLSISLGCSQ